MRAAGSAELSKGASWKRGRQRKRRLKLLQKKRALLQKRYERGVVCSLHSWVDRLDALCSFMRGDWKQVALSSAKEQLEAWEAAQEAAKAAAEEEGVAAEEVGVASFFQVLHRSYLMNDGSRPR